MKWKAAKKEAAPRSSPICWVVCHATRKFRSHSMLSTQSRLNTSSPGDGSRTITIHDVQSTPDASGDGSVDPTLSDGTLRLRGGPRSRPRVAWDERVVDNENSGRKKSKSASITSR